MQLAAAFLLLALLSYLASLPDGSTEWRRNQQRRRMDIGRNQQVDGNTSESFRTEPERAKPEASNTTTLRFRRPRAILSRIVLRIAQIPKTGAIFASVCAVLPLLLILLTTTATIATIMLIPRLSATFSTLWKKTTEARREESIFRQG